MLAGTKETTAAEEDNAADDPDDPDPAMSATGSYGWLLHRLPAIPHFDAVRPAVVSALRSAVLIEVIKNSNSCKITLKKEKNELIIIICVKIFVMKI